jgi:hypothetical protein
MKKLLLKFRFQPAIFVAAFALAICATAMAEQPESMSGQPVPPVMPQWCADMVKMHEDYLKMLKTQDAELSSQLDKLKAASGDQKSSAVEATLTLLIQQQFAQHADMENMVARMKDYISKKSCPMMRDMK